MSLSFLVPKKEQYYNVGYIDSNYNSPSQLCYSKSCRTRGMSMCRYPYYPKMSRLHFNTPPCVCGSFRYLYKV